jgi:hypothetical protein
VDIKGYKVKRKSLIILIAMLAFVLSSLTGCRKYEQITVTSGEVESVEMDGLKAVNVILRLEIDNPAGKVLVESAEGTVKHFGKVIGKITIAPVALLPRRTAEYHVKAHLELASGLKFMEILNLAAPGKLEEMTVDLSFTGKVGGVVVRRNINEVPLKKLLEKTVNEKI